MNGRGGAGLRAECRGLAMEDLIDRGWRFKYKTAKEGRQFRAGIDYKVSHRATPCHASLMSRRDGTGAPALDMQRARCTVSYCATASC